MHGSSVFEVTAKANGQMVETANLTTDGEKVGHRLRRVTMAAISSVDDGDSAVFGCHTRTAFFEMAHRNDIGKRAHHANRVGYRLTLAYRTALGIAEAKHLTAQLHHSGRETQARTGRGLIKERSQFLAFAYFGILLTMLDDVERTTDDLFYFLSRKIGRIK